MACLTKASSSCARVTWTRVSDRKEIIPQINSNENLRWNPLCSWAVTPTLREVWYSRYGISAILLGVCPYSVALLPPPRPPSSPDQDPLCPCGYCLSFSHARLGQQSTNVGTGFAYCPVQVRRETPPTPAGNFAVLPLKENRSLRLTEVWDSMQAEAHLVQGELIMKVKTDVKAGGLVVGIIVGLGGGCHQPPSYCPPPPPPCHPPKKGC